jgi:carbon monoxide dehydrogenase subunit G
MELEHAFTVPVGVDTAWAQFQDIASVAECFPGAQVTGVEGDTFNGSVKVKLGPIALVYNGSGTFTEKDEAAHRFVVDAKGKDKRGNGTAGATVTLAMQGNGESTDVNVHTDLAITGKPAQFGRGVMQDVSDKLLGQFVACLEQRLGDGAPAPAPAPAAGAQQDATGTAAEGPVAPADDTEPTVPPAEAPVGDETLAEPATGPAAPGPPPPASPPATSTTGRGSDEALDLGRTVLPVVARAYWKQALVAVIVIAVIVWLIVR